MAVLMAYVIWCPALAPILLACLQPTTQSNFWGNIGDGNMGTLKKKWLRTCHNILK